MILNGTSGGGSASPTYEGKPDLIAVLEHYDVFVTHSGKYLCCFHDETSPSLSVDVEEELFKCFSCGVAGDAWTAIETLERVDFKGAMAFAIESGFESNGEGGGGGGGFGRTRPKKRERGKPSRAGGWSPAW